MAVKFLPGTERMLLAGLVAGAQQSLHAAAIEAMREAQQSAEDHKRLTGQLDTTIHAVLPGESDRAMYFGGDVIEPIPGLSAAPNEAYVVMHTIRRPQGQDAGAHGDYGWWQENGPASEKEPAGRHHLRDAGDSIRGKHPEVTVGPVSPGSSFGGG